MKDSSRENSSKRAAGGGIAAAKGFRQMGFGGQRESIKQVAVDVFAPRKQRRHIIKVCAERMRKHQFGWYRGRNFVPSMSYRTWDFLFSWSKEERKKQ